MISFLRSWVQAECYYLAPVALAPFNGRIATGEAHDIEKYPTNATREKYGMLVLFNVRTFNINFNKYQLTPHRQQLMRYDKLF